MGTQEEVLECDRNTRSRFYHAFKVTTFDGRSQDGKLMLSGLSAHPNYVSSLVRFITDMTLQSDDDKEIREIAAEEFLRIVTANRRWSDETNGEKSLVMAMILSYVATFSDRIKSNLKDSLNIIDTHILLAANLSESGREELARLMDSFVVDSQSAAKKPNFCLRALRLLESPLVEDEKLKLKQELAIDFKDTVKSCWVLSPDKHLPPIHDSPIHDWEKERVNGSIVSVMVKTKHPSIESDLLEAIACVGFSEEWPSLLLDLASTLDEANQAMDHGLLTRVLSTWSFYLTNIFINNLIINLYKNMSNKSSRVDKFLCCRSFQIELVEFFDRNPRWDIYGQRTHYLNLSGDLTPYLLHLLVQLLEFSPQLDSRFQLFIDTLFVSDTWSSSLNVPAFLILSRFYILEKPERLVKLISDFCWNNDPQKVSVGYLLLKVAIVSFGINNWSIWGDAWAKLLYPDGVSLWDSISFDSNTLPRRNLSWWIKGHICFSLYILKFGVEGIEWVANAMGFTYDNFVKHSWIPLLKLVGLVEYVDANEAKTILVAAIRFLCGSPYLLSPSNWLTMLEIIVLHLQHQEEDIN